VRFAWKQRRRGQIVAEDGCTPHRHGELVRHRLVSEVGLLVPGHAGLMDAVKMFVELVTVEQDDLQANLASGQEDKSACSATGLFSNYLCYTQIAANFLVFFVDPEYLHKEYPGY
jgi:hypothetical protein